MVYNNNSSTAKTINWWINKWIQSKPCAQVMRNEQKLSSLESTMSRTILIQLDQWLRSSYDIIVVGCLLAN